ncbi:MAG: hypothetical protein NTY64_13185 [Deltaproteobacteria bacterium]|nr:hypothetical protein [Deltaproteobacteria bacterium]
MATSKSKHKRMQHKFSLRAKRRKERAKARPAQTSAPQPSAKA